MIATADRLARNSARGGVALILLAIVGLDSLSRYRLAPPWLAEGVSFAVIAAMACAALTERQPWRRLEVIALWGGTALGIGYNALNLYNVIDKLAFHAVQPSPLFYSALVIWIDNILLFTLVYWLVDRGGPDARMRGTAALPDFDFPAMSEPEKVRADWQPSFVDYLFIGFTTSTAFSPTEAQPLTSRAKLLMMAQSTISLATIAIVAARAVNIIQ